VAPVTRTVKGSVMGPTLGSDVESAAGTSPAARALSLRHPLEETV
jgi:hypothetical protein